MLSFHLLSNKWKPMEYLCPNTCISANFEHIFYYFWYRISNYGLHQFSILKNLFIIFWLQSNSWFAHNNHVLVLMIGCCTWYSVLIFASLLLSVWCNSLHYKQGVWHFVKPFMNWLSWWQFTCKYWLYR